MTEVGEVREMWSGGIDEEPVQAIWHASGAKQAQWERIGPITGWTLTATEGEDVFPTREAAIRHEIEATEAEREVRLRGLADAEARLARLRGMIGGGGVR